MLNDIDGPNKIRTDPDFVYMNRYHNSIKELLDRYPDGCPDHIIASAFEITEEELEERFQRLILDLKVRMGV
jgi:hypothetical protein